MLSWKSELRPGAQDTPKEQWRQTRPLTAAYNIKEWMQGLGEDASKVEVRNDEMRNHGTEQKKVHSQHVGRDRRWHRRQGIPQLPKTLLVDLPLQEEGVKIREANGVPISQPWWEGLGRATEQEGQEEVKGEGQSANLQGWKDQTHCDLLFLVVGCSYFLPLRLGWPTIVVVHLVIITGVPWRPCQEFRWGYYLNQCHTDVGWALGHVDDVSCI